MDPRVEKILKEITQDIYSIPSPIDTCIKDMFYVELSDKSTQTAINSRTLRDEVKKLSKKLKNTSNSIDIIKISDIFCTKLHMYFLIPNDIANNVVEKMKDVICTDNELRMRHKFRFIRFSNMEISDKIAEKVYDNDVQWDYVPLFQLMKFILKNTGNKSLRQRVIDKFKRIFDDPMVNEFVKMDVADCLILSNEIELGEEMLEVLRERQRQREELTNPRNCNIYQDSQNVHNHNINNSVIRVAYELCKKGEQKEFNSKEVIEELSEIYPYGIDLFTQILDRVQIDTSEFVYNDPITEKPVRLNMYIVFANLWHYIKKHQQSVFLKGRLIEEFDDMKVYCSTGHLARLINIIQGVTEDEKLCIRISDEQQINSVITNYLTTELQNSSDEIKESMYGSDEEKLPFYTFVVDKLNDRIDGWIEDYGENMLQTILSSVIHYIDSENIILSNGKFCLKTK